MNNSILIQLPKYLDGLGNLSVIEEMKDIPFNIERAPRGESCGGHVYKRKYIIFTTFMVAWSEGRMLIES